MSGSTGTYHLAGVAGVGMSALAEALVQMGYAVSGSDRFHDMGVEVPILGKLAAMGVRLVPQDGSALDASTDGLIISTAVEESNPEIQRARELGVPVIHRAVMLEQLASGKDVLAVAGTAGKTTTTGILGWLLQELGLGCSVVNGGVVLNWKKDDAVGSARVQDPATWVLEVDESDKSLLNFHPAKAVLTNISKDHYELDELREMFLQFCSQVKGEVFLLPETLDFLGTEVPNASVVEPDEIAPGSFKYKDVVFKVPLPGLHNAWNSFFAAVMAESLGFSLQLIQDILPRFEGIERRLQLVGVHGQNRVYDDYAHNPAKIAAAWETVRPASGRVIGVWRPHGFGPLKVMLEEFAETFSRLLETGDQLLLLPVYYVGGTASKDISSADLFQKLDESQCVLVEDFQAAEEWVMEHICHDDVVVALGARDPGIPEFAQKVAARLVEK